MTIVYIFMNMRQGEMNTPKLTKEQIADDYIFDSKYPSTKKLALIKKRHKESTHKRNTIPTFFPYGYFFRPSGDRF